MDFHSNLSTEQRLLLLEEENRLLKIRLTKAKNDADTGVALGMVATISLPILTIFVIASAVNSGLLETNFVMNALTLSAIFIVCFVLPFVTMRIAVTKIKKNK